MCLLMLCVAPVMGIRENFQNWTNGSVLTNGFISLHDSYTVAQSFVADQVTAGHYVENADAAVSTYMAFDVINAWYNNCDVTMYDSVHNNIGSLACGPTTPQRIEIKIIGTVPKLYYNGILYSTGSALTVNPSYFKIVPRSGGWNTIDNIVIGETDHHVVGALPSNWTILRDFINPSADGVYAGYNTTSLYPWVLKNSLYFYIDADTDSLDDVTTETFQISNVATGTVVNSTTINSTVPYHQVRYYLSQWLDTSTVPDGQYAACFEGSSVCGYFWILSNGGQIVFDHSSYNIGDTGAMTWYLSTGYIDVSTYDYSYKLVDIYGVTKKTGVTAVSNTDTSGTASITFDDLTYDPGVLYAEMIATSKTTGSTYILGYSAITLNEYLSFYGYVNDAETTSVISGANVSIVQGAVVYNHVTGTAGNYTTGVSPFGSGAAVSFNVTAPGYIQYLYTTTPLAAKTVIKNITLKYQTTTATGITLNGIILDDTYQRPVTGAAVVATNTSHGTSHSVTSNDAGYYVIDNSRGGPLTSGYCYLVNATLTKYTQTYPSAMKCVV
jgi:hypothetical protein